MDRRSTNRGLPIFFRLRRRCFKKVFEHICESRWHDAALTLSRLAGDKSVDGSVAKEKKNSGDDKNEKIEHVLKEFCGKWQVLLADQVRSCSRERANWERFCASVFGTRPTNSG